MSQDIFRNGRGLRAGWRILLWFCALLVSCIPVGVFFGIAMALSGDLSFASPGHAPKMATWVTLSAEGTLFAFLFPLTALIAVFIEKRPTRSLGLAFHSRWIREFGAGLLSGTLLLSLVVLILRAVGVYQVSGPQEGIGGAALWGILFGATFLGVGFFEEFMFRGYLLQTLVGGCGVPAAFIITCLFFGLVHVPNHGETFVGILNVFAAGAMLAVIVLRTRSLWLAVGLHATWDWSQNFLYGTPDSGIVTPGGLFHTTAAHGPGWLSGASDGPEGSVVALVILMAATLYFSRCRWLVPSPESKALWDRYVLRIEPGPVFDPRTSLEFDLDPVSTPSTAQRVEFDLDPVSTPSAIQTLEFDLAPAPASPDSNGEVPREDNGKERPA
ncbi:MAG TPA: CPBP family intramembrane glutamic endopeptidase [Armatimonadota bacterium]|nr:CPBP family intramembrane glutamic endopeptidase [Armatimonadota bacterium]